MKKILIVMMVALSCNQSKEEANIFFLKGNVALKDKNFNEAIKYYNEAIKKQSQFADAYNNIGISYQKIGDFKNAEINFKNAIENDDKYADAKLNYANLIINSNTKTALELLNSIEKEMIDSANYCNTRGQAEFINADFNKASFFLNKAVLLKPNNAEFLTNLGTLLYYQKNYNEAETKFIKSFKLDSNNAMTINNLGLISMKNNTKNTAFYFKKALTLEPKNQLILNNYNYFLTKNNDFLKSEEILALSESIDSSNPYFLRNKGNLAIAKGELNGLQYLEEAFKKNASIENIHSELGFAYLKNNNNPKACEYWQKGKILEENESEAYLLKYCK